MYTGLPEPWGSGYAYQWETTQKNGACSYFQLPIAPDHAPDHAPEHDSDPLSDPDSDPMITFLQKAKMVDAGITSGSSISCDICQCVFNNPDIFAVHLETKKHKVGKWEKSKYHITFLELYLLRLKQ